MVYITYIYMSWVRDGPATRKMTDALILKGEEKEDKGERLAVWKRKLELL